MKIILVLVVFVMIMGMQVYDAYEEYKANKANKISMGVRWLILGLTGGMFFYYVNTYML